MPKQKRKKLKWRYDRNYQHSISGVFTIFHNHCYKKKIGFYLRGENGFIGKFKYLKDAKKVAQLIHNG